MVSDLSKINSHPNKPLKVHVEGVMKKAALRDKGIITRLAALFHDLGKMNPNFQDKIKGAKNTGYSQHSYISAFAFLNWYDCNKNKVKTLLGVENNDFTNLKIISAIILHHHGDLPNLDENVSNLILKEMIGYLKKENEKLLISKYLNQELLFEHNPFDLSVKKWYERGIPNLDLGKESELNNWKKDALANFMKIQFSFASLIEADKRDAGDNEIYNFKKNLKKSIDKLDNSLNDTYDNFASTKNISRLNQLRTEIRIEAVNKVASLLAKGQRIYTLTAPTGGGKTYTLLSIAKEIQKLKGDLGIIFALPFLSITEQVEDIIKKLEIDVLSVNSKSYNERIEKAQFEYETHQSKEKLKNLLVEDFVENTFDHPFVITTFVQFFETLVSNRNSTLLKLPNFANRIFLIDEIQALPPRLYIFFSALLDAFCKQNNSYAVLSTATMPNLGIPEKKELEENTNFSDKNPALLFKNYQKPNDLLEATRFFEQDIFNRYKVTVIKDELNINSLADNIRNQNKSCLIILNTIQDTKDLYEILKEESNLFLLNTHFTPHDRLKKIEKIKKLLPISKVMLISTQLIEAGVDIDFPIVFRDFCPLPSLIQSAGRCNRNGKFEFGHVFLFQLVKENGKFSSELIYRKEARQFLKFLRKNVTDTVEEKELFTIQQKFFNSIANDLEIGYYPEERFNMIECINNAQLDILGKFQLINNRLFGCQYQYYVPIDENDNEYEKLSKIVVSIDGENYEEVRKSRIYMNQQLKKMSRQILTVRAIDESFLPPKISEKDVCGIRKLDTKYYSEEKGLKILKESYLIL